ncbi:MAG: hypothetical protein Q7R85_00235 [bacterium]|nr:hypothetical protein [bacterium]
MTLYFGPSKFLLLCFLASLLLFSSAHAQTAGTWDSRAAVSASVSQSASLLAYPGSGNLIYQRRGDDNTFNSYSISGDSWSALTSDNCGAGIGNGSFLVRGDSGFLYAACPGGNDTTDFVRYDISGADWEERATSPSGFGNGAAAVWDGSDYIYALPGDAMAAFYRYTISTNVWDSMTASPTGVTGGGSLAYPGSGNFIYAFRGSDLTTFYRYHITENDWSPITAAPDTVGGGGSLVAIDTSTIYALRGEGGGTPRTDFWSYGISGDSWTVLTVAPAAVGAGGSLAYVSNSSGTFLYQLRGNATTDFNRYTISVVAASTGSSAGSFLLAARQDGGLSLARATPPASPTNVVVTPLPCNGTCGATIALSYAALSVHRGRPMTFAFIDESGKTLGSIYEPYANGKSYTMELKNLPQNSPLNGRLCAQFSPGEGCANVQSWTLWSLDAAKVKLSAAPEGDRYRVRVAVPPFMNEGVDASGVRVAIEENGAVKPMSMKNGRVPAATLAQVVTTIGTHETITQVAPFINTAITPPAPSGGLSVPRTTLDVISILPVIQAAPKTGSGGISVPSKAAPSPVPVKESLPGTLLQRSGEWATMLAPGEYRMVLTPINGKGVLGVPLTLPLSLKPFGEAMTLTAGMEAEDGTLRTIIDATSNRLGNTGIDIIAERKGSAFAFRSTEKSVEVRVSLVAALAKAEEHFDFVFACAPGGGNCAVKSVAAQKGNIINRAAIAKNSNGFVTVKTEDAIATVRVTEGITQISISATGELKRLRSEEYVALNALRGGTATFSVSAADVLGNTAAIRDVPVNIPGSEAAIAAFTVTSAGDEGDVEARGVIDYSNFTARGLLLNLSFAEEGLSVEGTVASIPQLVQLLVARDDGTGVQFALSCEASPQAGEASPQVGEKTCGIVAIAAPQGTPLEVVPEENPDGTMRAEAGGITLTYDTQNALPMLVGADAAGFSNIEIRARYPSFGLGNFTGVMIANEARASAAFFGVGKYLNLFPEVIEKVILDLAPLIINYIAPQNAAPIIESVEGSRMVSQSRPVQILRQASEVGAPVSPLLNAIRNLFGGEQ